MFKFSSDNKRISYTIITLPANEFMLKLHDRMPAMLNPELEKLWLDPTLGSKDVISLITPYESDKMDAYPVSGKVGNVREKGAELIDKIEL